MLEEAERLVRQAARLLVAELSEIDHAIREAASAGAYWTDSMAGRELPTATWNAYRDVLAMHADAGAWRLTAEAFQAANDLNWRLRARKLARPIESKALRAVWDLRR